MRWQVENKAWSLEEPTTNVSNGAQCQTRGKTVSSSSLPGQLLRRRATDETNRQGPEGHSGTGERAVQAQPVSRCNLAIMENLTTGRWIQHNLKVGTVPQPGSPKGFKGERRQRWAILSRPLRGPFQRRAGPMAFERWTAQGGRGTGWVESQLDTLQSRWFVKVVDGSPHRGHPLC